MVCAVPLVEKLQEPRHVLGLQDAEICQRRKMQGKVVAQARRAFGMGETSRENGVDEKHDNNYTLVRRKGSPQVGGAEANKLLGHGKKVCLGEQRSLVQRLFRHKAAPQPHHSLFAHIYVLELVKELRREGGGMSVQASAERLIFSSHRIDALVEPGHVQVILAVRVARGAAALALVGHAGD